MILRFLLPIILLMACSNTEKRDNEISQKDSVGQKSNKRIERSKQKLINLPDTSFVNLNHYSDGFAYDLKYATTDNFIKEIVYECDHCIIRKEVADALILANDSLKKLGLKIKFFDCYRPLDVQRKMWEVYPDSRYVANPNTSGSIHNRGGAVDITLIDNSGNEINMGTHFDHFGEKAHHSYLKLSESILNNRKLLKNIMQAFNFTAISTEWWHYNYNTENKYQLSNFQTSCD